MKISNVCAGLAAATLLAGCAASRGPRQDEVPPRLVERNKTVVWDRGAAFGPVPLQLAAVATTHCAALDTRDVTWQVEGFHAKAQDLHGRTLPGGGYFCTPRAAAR